MLKANLDYTKGVNLLALSRQMDITQSKTLNLRPALPEDNVVGTVSVELQHVWAAYCHLLREAERLVAGTKKLDEAHFIYHMRDKCNGRGCLGLTKKLERTKEQALAAEHLATYAALAFWNLATVELCIEETDQSFALREGFIVVTTDEDEDDRPQLGAWLSELSVS